MPRKLIAFSLLISLTALFLFNSGDSLAQQRVKKAEAALLRADALFVENKYSEAATDYRIAADDLPKGDGRNRAITRMIVSLAESDQHQALYSLSDKPKGFIGCLADADPIIKNIDGLNARTETYRIASMYLATRLHTYHQKKDVRHYDLDLSNLEGEERRAWRYHDDTSQDLSRAKELMALAYDDSRTFLATNDNAEKSAIERHVAITLEYCDLIEVVERNNGVSTNHSYFFGNLNSSTLRYDDNTDEYLKTEGISKPGEEPFTRRGYYSQPYYPSLSTINTLLETAAFRAEILKDKPLQASVLYRRAMLMMNVGLYGNAELNAKLTDWKKPQTVSPDISKDPRPLLRKLLREHKGSIWDDEAQFLLGYTNYYYNDFSAAKTEFAALEKQYPKSRYIGEARRLLQVIEYPQLFTSFNDGLGSSPFVAPGADLSVSVYARNIEAVKVSLKPIDLGKLISGTTNVDHLYRELSDIEKLAGFDAAIGSSVMDLTFKLDSTKEHFYQSRTGLPLYTSLPGVYLLEVTGGPVIERKLVQIADLAVNRRRLTSTEQIWITTLNGQPLPEAYVNGGYYEEVEVEIPYQVEVLIDKEDPSQGMHLVTKYREAKRVVQHAIKGETDGNGMFEAALPAHDIQKFWAAIEVHGQTYLINDSRSVRKITDRADWLPEPVSAPVKDLRAFVYTDRPVYRPGDTAWLRVITRLPMGEGQIEGEQALLRVLYNGVEQYSEAVRLNEFGCATVRYQIPFGAPVGDYTLKIDSPRIGGDTTYTLKVLEYFKKDIKLEIAVPNKPVAVGSEIKVPVTFSYLAGGRVQRGAIEYKVYAKAFGGKNWSVMADYKETNLDGQVVLSVDSEEVSRKADGKAVTLTVTAGGYGPGGQIVYARAEFKLSGGGITASAKWPSSNWNANKFLQMNLRVLNPDGQRFRATGKYSIYRIADQSSLDSSSWGNASKRLESSGTFDDRGVSKFVGIKMPSQSGRYYVEAGGTAEGNGFSFSHSVLHIGDGQLDNRTFAILPEFDKYDLTKPGRLLVTQPSAGKVLFSLHADGNESVHSTLTCRTSDIKVIKLAERNAPYVHISARAVRGGSYYSDSYGIAVEPASRRIRTIVSFDKEKYKPGETATASLFTSNHLGEPVQAEVALSVWDSALKGFTDSALEDFSLFTHFFSGRTSFDAEDVNLTERTRVQSTRRHVALVTQWTTYKMPPGSFFSGSQSWMTSTTIDMSDMYESPGKLFYRLRMAQEAKNSMDVTWGEETQKTDSPFYGHRGGGGFSYRRSGGGSGFGYRRGGGGGGRPFESRPDVPNREKFEDSAFFSGNIRTNANGAATVSFKLPDNLTEWTFEATSTDKLAAIGQTSGTFTASKNFSLRMIGPRGLVEGDEIELSALIQNLTDKPVSGDFKVELNVKDSTANLSLLRAPEDSFGFIPAGATREMRFRAKVSGTGHVSLKVSASTEDNADVLIWKYRVVAKGMPFVTVERFMLEEGEEEYSIFTDLPESAVVERSSLTVQFNGSILGSVVDALPGLISYPYG